MTESAKKAIQFWKAQEIETVQAFHMGNGEMLYFMDCPECGKIRVEGERRNKP